ncbi:transposable element Tcb1 transposase [Trichonephila clavipes]|nr:transposable element Tcb1 transposase [Trichonephila clavipes]
MAVNDRTASSRQLAARWSIATAVLMSASSIRRRLQPRGLRARVPLYRIPFTSNHQWLRLQWVHEHKAWLRFHIMDYPICYELRIISIATGELMKITDYMFSISQEHEDEFKGHGPDPTLAVSPTREKSCRVLITTFCFIYLFAFVLAKRKRANRRQKALRARERRAAETVEDRKKRLAAMAQCNQERRAEETEEQRSRRLAAMAQRIQERREEETEEQRSRRLAAMAQRDQERRAEETEEQRSHQLSTMAQHARRRRVNVTEEQNCLQVQTFYAARTFPCC